MLARNQLYFLKVEFSYQQKGLNSRKDTLLTLLNGQEARSMNLNKLRLTKAGLKDAILCLILQNNKLKVRKYQVAEP